MTRRGFHVSRHCTEPVVIRSAPDESLVQCCDACEYNRAGFCRRCLGKRDRGAMYCSECIPLIEREQKADYAKRMYRTNEAYRQKQLAAHRVYDRTPARREALRRWAAKRGPRPKPTDLDRLYHRVWEAQANANPAYRDARNARRREIWTAKRAARRAGLPVTAWRSFDPRRKANPSPRSVAA